jgi:hypothetical protein
MPPTAASGISQTPMPGTPGKTQKPPVAQAMPDETVAKQLKKMGEKIQIQRHNTVRERAAMNRTQSEQLKAVREQQKILQQQPALIAQSSEGAKQLEALKAQLRKQQQEQAAMKKMQAEQMKKMKEEHKALMKQQLEIARAGKPLHSNGSKTRSEKVSHQGHQRAGGTTAGAIPDHEKPRAQTHPRKNRHGIKALDSDTDGHRKREEERKKMEKTKRDVKKKHEDGSSSDGKHGKEKSKHHLKKGEERKKRSGEHDRTEPKTSRDERSEADSETDATETEEDWSSSLDDDASDVLIDDDQDASEDDSEYGKLQQQIDQEYPEWREENAESDQEPEDVPDQQDQSQSRDQQEAQIWNNEMSPASEYRDPRGAQQDTWGNSGYGQGLDYRDGSYQQEPWQYQSDEGQDRQWGSKPGYDDNREYSYGGTDNQYQAPSEPRLTPNRNDRAAAYLAGGVALGAVAGAGAAAAYGGDDYDGDTYFSGDTYLSGEDQDQDQSEQQREYGVNGDEDQDEYTNEYAEEEAPQLDFNADANDNAYEASGSRTDAEEVGESDNGEGDGDDEDCCGCFGGWCGSDDEVKGESDDEDGCCVCC